MTTPAMTQHQRCKRAYPDCIIFFRLGDFYEVFDDDATLCASILHITLTARGDHPMAGIPARSADRYIPLLLAQGCKIAVVEQLTDPKPGALVERDVVRIITPGSYIDETHTHERLLASVVRTDDIYHACRMDCSLGLVTTRQWDDMESMLGFLSQLSIHELVLDPKSVEHETITDFFRQSKNIMITIHPLPPNPDSLIDQFCPLESIDPASKASKWAVACAFSYLLSLSPYKHFATIPLDGRRIIAHSAHDTLRLDPMTIRNLEIFSPLHQDTDSSLYSLLNTCASAPGSRYLAHLMRTPSTIPDTIRHRQIGRKKLMTDPNRCQSLYSLARRIGDPQRLIRRIRSGNGNWKIYRQLLTFLELWTQPDRIRALSVTADTTTLSTTEIAQSLNKFLSHKLHQTFDSNVDHSPFQSGRYPEHDDLILKHSRLTDDIAAEYTLLASHFSCKPKIKDSPQGLCIEITPSQHDRFVEEIIVGHHHYGAIMLTSLKTATRYTTPALAGLTEIRNHGKTRLDEIINEGFARLQKWIIDTDHHRSLLIDQAAYIDCMAALARRAIDYNRTCPEIDTPHLAILKGRHPVVESVLGPTTSFVPNDCMMRPIGSQSCHTQMADDYGLLHIITGPNMGGKSTYLRQNALIVYLSHCGFPVPAAHASIPIYDALFARIGAGDNLVRNQSTFMTEMLEVARILNTATSRSFIVFDEIGRGTSTYDGLALCQAIVEYTATIVGCHCLLATHYHELISLADSYEMIRNYHAVVSETSQSILFLKKIVAGGAEKSFGIHVAQRAGLPQRILDRASHVLTQRETSTSQQKRMTDIEATGLFSDSIEKERIIRNPMIDSIIEQITNLDLEHMTPLQALTTLAGIKESLRKKHNTN